MGHMGREIGNVFSTVGTDAQHVFGAGGVVATAFSVLGTGATPCGIRLRARLAPRVSAGYLRGLGRSLRAVCKRASTP